MMAAAAVGPGESPTQQVPNSGVPSEGGPVDAATNTNSGGRRPEASPIQQSPIPAVGALEETSGQRAQAQAGRGPTNNSSFRRPAQGPMASGGFPWLEASTFAFLTFNSAMAIYQSWGNAEEISFHAYTYSNIVFLFVCLRLFQAAPLDSDRRKKHAVAAWISTMSLVFGFAYRIDEVTRKPTLQVALLLWSMPAAAAIGVFILLFRQDHSYSPDAPEDEELLSPV